MLDSMEALGISTRLDVCTECWSSAEERRIMGSPGAFLFFNFYLYFILLYSTVLVLPYIDMNQPWVYMKPNVL